MEYPQSIREHAISEAYGAVKNTRLKYKKTGEFQRIQFRKKRDPIQSFGSDAHPLNQNFVLSRQDFKLEFHLSKKVKSDLKSTRTVREGSCYFLVLPQRQSIYIPENQRTDAVALLLYSNQRTIISLD